MAKIERALVSVSDKAGLVEFVKGLAEFGVEIISTGGTAKKLHEASLKVTEISDYTGFPEMMDGRVKTLHPKVHGGLLALRDNPEHVAAMKKHDIKRIDMVVVNLYPFEQTIAKKDVKLEDAIEQIDIGGPSMIRSAAKNHKYVAVVTSPSQYGKVLAEMKSSGGEVSETLCRELAIEVFRLTSHYDNAIASYLTSRTDADGSKFPATLSVRLAKVGDDLRYGENWHQSAAFYRLQGASEPSVSTAQLLGGKAISYNNILDTDGALELVKEFATPAVAIIKHTNPAGCGTGDDIHEAFERAYTGDPVSAFGGIIAVNRPVDAKLAKQIVRKREWPVFYEVIIAPHYEDEALKVLTTSKKWCENLRVLKVGSLENLKRDAAELNLRSVIGGMLAQDRDLLLYKGADLKVVSKRKPSDAEMGDLNFAWILCKHVKSNAIVFAKNQTLLSMGPGQPSRIDSTIIAAMKSGVKCTGAALGSDAFFPFPDVVEKAAEVGIAAIIQPGGSSNDQMSIDAVDKHGMAMVFTGTRHFRH